MPLTCPACRAANDAGPACRRCKADLALCFAVERQRAATVAAARAAAAQGDLPRAFSHAGRAAALRRGDDVRQLRAALALLAGDFAGAWGASRA
jgi:hypothetical protein